MWQICRAMAAISRSQAIVEFDLDGTVLNANDLFLSVMAIRWLP